MNRNRVVVFVWGLLVAMSLAASGQGDGQQPVAQPGAGVAGQSTPGEAVQFQVPPMRELPNGGLGETDTPMLPGQRWRVRDLNRPHPPVVTPGRSPGQPPSDAIVLFDGSDLSQWIRGGLGANASGGQTAPGWKVQDGYVEVTPGAGTLVSKARFGDLQLHVEFASPPVPLGKAQYRGNSGIMLGGSEIQILDVYNNQTYADGYLAAVYGQWPPLANPARPPGEWQVLDIAYMAARYDGERLVRNAFVTMFLNGVMVHNNREILPAAGRGGGRGAANPAGARGDQPIVLMDHTSAIPGNAVRYRNIWERRVDVELHSPVTLK